MTPRVYYNDTDTNCAAWLRELMRAKVIPDGDIDTRSIWDVEPHDLEGFVHCHFFAGIGGWAYALRLAGWPDDRPIWTGSCPCQPFSVAGRGRGARDPRHLWPAWKWLIRQSRPATIAGEQVASRAARAWLDVVCADLEGLDFAVAAADLCAAGEGAPHIRQRLYWVADAERDPRGTWRPAGESTEGARTAAAGASIKSGRCRVPRGLADDEARRRRQVDSLAGRRDEGAATQGRERSGSGVIARGLGHDERARLEGHRGHGDDGRQPRRHDAHAHRPAPTTSRVDTVWDPCDWLPCIDGKARPVEPGTFPLAHGVPARVGRLRGYGNAIVPHVAATFLTTYMEIRGIRAVTY